MPEIFDLDFEGRKVSLRELSNITGIHYSTLYERIRRTGRSVDEALAIPVRNPRKLKPHGKTGSQIYRVWSGIIQRCSNPKSKVWKWYGGRGIAVCEAWKSFESFYRDVGDPPTPDHELDRKDNNRGYCSDNCHWVSHKENARNRFYEKFVDFEGEKVSVAELSERFNINYDTLTHRIRNAGWTVTKAVYTPVRPGYCQKHRSKKNVP